MRMEIHILELSRILSVGDWSLKCGVSVFVKNLRIKFLKSGLKPGLCRYGDFWMSSYQLMFSGARSFLVFSSFVFKHPASSFQSYSYSNLKTSSIQHR